MDRLILAEKLESLRRCLRRVEAKRVDRADELRGDPDRQDIVSLNLTRAVQLATDMAMHVIADSEQDPPQTMAEAFDGLHEMGVIDDHLAARMKAAVGFRNIAIHNYRNLDWEIIHRITHEGVDQLTCYARAIATLIDG